MADAKKEHSEKVYYSVKMTHNEDSFKALAHMQYDLFCRRNYIARTIVSISVILLALRLGTAWYSMLLIAYGAFLMTGKYNAANHTAGKLVKGLQDAGLPFPSSEFIFEKDKMRVISLIDGEELSPLSYSAILKLGSDMRYFYLFRNESGGYMIPREQLGEKAGEFKSFIESRTGKSFMSKFTSPFSRLMAWQRQKENEPYHL